MGKSVERFVVAEHRLWQAAGCSPKERRVHLPSGGMVRIQELGEGEPLLFVHGASNAGTIWVDLIAVLARQGFRCIALDRPGCGLSDPIVKGPLRNIEAVEAYADTLVCHVMDALDLPTAHVAAMSYGGYFALRGAAAHPDRISRVVEFSWPVGAPLERVPLAMRLAAIPGLQTLTAGVPPTRWAVKAVLRQIGLARALDNGRCTDDMVDWFVSVLRDTDTMSNELRSSSKIVTPICGINRRLLLSDALLARVTMPVLFLWGDEDPNGGEAIARSFVERIPNARLELVPQAGHAPWIDELDLCASRTRDFLVN